MQDNDFDKIFSHKFGQLPGEPYDEENWSEFSRRMDMHIRRRTRWVLPALFFLLGTLTGGNVFWWYQWREADRKLQHYESRTTLYQTDTLMRGKVVYHYDTIYQNVTAVVRQQETTGPVQSSTIAASNSSYLNDIDTAARQNQAAGFSPVLQASYDLTQQVDSSSLNVQEQEEQLISNGDAASPGHTIVRKTPMDTSALVTPPRSIETAIADTIENEVLNDQTPLTKKSRSPFLYFARPRLGMNAIWGIPNLSHKISGTIFGAGIRGDVEIARNFRLGAEVAYQQASLKSDDTQALESIDIDIPNPGSDFRLKYWETNFLPSFTYALHLRYEIPLGGNWTPWFGVGGQAITCMPFEVEYEFENEINNIELHVPAKAGSSTYVQGIMFMLGAECRLNPHLYFGAEGYMLRSIGEEEDDHEEEGQGLLEDQFGLKTSIIYKF